DEFTGARDQRFVRAFLARLAPSAEELSLERARQHLARGEARAAEELLRPLTGPGAADASLQEALVRLAEALLQQGAERLGEVPALLDRVDPRSKEAERAERLRQLLDFYRAAQDFGGEARATEALEANPRD